MMSSLESLPPEVRQKIIDYCARSDMVNLAVCSKFLKSEVVPILWKEVCIDWQHLVDERVNAVTLNLAYTRNLSFCDWGCLENSHGYKEFNFAFILRRCDPTKLRSFFAYMYIVPHGLQLVAEMFPLLTILKLSYIKDTSLDLVSRFRLLEEVHLAGCEITDEQMRKICLLENLRILHVGAKHLTGEVLKHISNVAALQKLSFRSQEKNSSRKF